MEVNDSQTPCQSAHVQSHTVTDESDWLRIQNNYSGHAKKIGPPQSLRFLVLTKRSATSGDENVQQSHGIFVNNTFVTDFNHVMFLCLAA